MAVAAGGAVVLAITWLAALSSTVSGFEEALFRPVNDLPDWLESPAWPFMQAGALAFVPVAALVVAAVWRRLDLTVSMLSVGVVGWLLAKVVKDIVERGRPADLLADVVERPDWQGLGFVSGHAVIAFGLATVVAPHLPRIGRVAVFGAAAIAGVLRIYTGAHLPYDVVGGAALGVALGALARLAMDRAGNARPATEAGADG
jgi:membrane-associated phospholipid phosphatase